MFCRQCYLPMWRHNTGSKYNGQPSKCGSPHVKHGNHYCHILILLFKSQDVHVLEQWCLYLTFFYIKIFSITFCHKESMGGT